MKYEVGYKFSTVVTKQSVCNGIRLVTWNKTNYNGNDRGKAAFTANNKQNKPY